jgi:hypothetical protein
MIPPKPKGSQMEEELTPEACTFKWPLPLAGIKELRLALPMLCLMAFLVYSVVRLPRQGVGRFNVGDLWWLLIALGPLILVLLPLLRLLRPSRPESITLGPDFFRHRLVLQR